MLTLVKVRDALWQGHGFGRSPADYELRDTAGAMLGTLTCLGRGSSWTFRPNASLGDGRPRHYRTLREARAALVGGG